MKTKIAKALKTKYASKGLSDKALDGVAAFLEKTVTEESQIDAAISEASVEALLNVYQSEADALRNQKAQAEKALAEYKAAHPELGQEPPKEEKPNDQTAEILKQLNELKARAEREDAFKRQSEMITGVRKALKDGNRGVDALLDIVLKDAVISKDDTVETLTKRYGEEYDTQYRKLYGDGAIPPFGSAFKGPQAGDKSDFSSVVNRLREEGKLAHKDK